MCVGSWPWARARAALSVNSRFDYERVIAFGTPWSPGARHSPRAPARRSPVVYALDQPRASLLLCRRAHLEHRDAGSVQMEHGGSVGMSRDTVVPSGAYAAAVYVHWWRGSRPRRAAPNHLAVLTSHSSSSITLPSCSRAVHSYAPLVSDSAERRCAHTSVPAC